MSMAFPGTYLKKYGASAYIGIQSSTFLLVKYYQKQKISAEEGRKKKESNTNLVTVCETSNMEYLITCTVSV